MTAVRIASPASCKAPRPCGLSLVRPADELQLTHHSECYDLTGVPEDSTLQLTIVWTPSSIHLSTGSALRIRHKISIPQLRQHACAHGHTQAPLQDSDDARVLLASAFGASPQSAPAAV